MPRPSSRSCAGVRWLTMQTKPKLQYPSPTLGSHQGYVALRSWDSCPNIVSSSVSFKPDLVAHNSCPCPTLYLPAHVLCFLAVSKTFSGPVANKRTCDLDAW